LDTAELVIRVVNLVVHRDNYVFSGVEQFSVLQTFDQVDQRHMLAKKDVHCNDFSNQFAHLGAIYDGYVTPGDSVSLLHDLVHGFDVFWNVVGKLKGPGDRQFVLSGYVLNTEFALLLL